MPYYVYILTGSTNAALYTGCTSDLRRRLEQHRAKAADAHTAKYNLTKLIYFETHETLDDARVRERRLKRWRSAWKSDLVASLNPQWRDLSAEIPL